MNTNNQDKIIHVLGGGTNQLPLVQKIKNMGYKVLVTDMYENPPCKKEADFFEQINTTDKEATLKCSEKYKIYRIITDQTDVAVPTVAFISDALKLPSIGYEVALIFTNKYMMREKLRVKNLDLIPEFNYFSNVVDCINFYEKNKDKKLIIKPVNSQGSKGVFILQESNYKEAISDSFLESKNRGILLEQFIGGHEFSVEAYTENGKTYDLAITKKYHYIENDCIDEKNTYLGDVAPEIEKILFEANRKIIEALGLPFGISHAEYKVEKGKVYLMEIAARGAGGSISSYIIPFLTDFDPLQALINHILGIPNNIIINDYKRRYAILKFFNFKKGKVKNIYFNSSIAKDLLFFTLDIKSGDTIRPIKDSRDRAGYFIVHGFDRNEVIQKEKLVESSVQIEYE